MKCLPPALLLLLVACYPQLLLAQEPVPRPGQIPIPFGEQRGTLAISGTVTDSSGAALPGALVTATNIYTEEKRQARTDEVGQFAVFGLSPGRYRVNVSLTGFNQEEREVDLQPGQTATLQIKLVGGPVPRGDPKPTYPPEIGTKPKPKPKPGAESPVTPSATTTRVYAVEVLRVTLHNGAAFQSWLNEQTEKRKKLLAIIPLQNTISMFVLVPVEADEKLEYDVDSANKPLQPKELRAHIESRPKKVFVGIHRLSHRSFLMVFRHEGK